MNIQLACENLIFWDNIAYIIRIAEALGSSKVFLIGKSVETYNLHKKKADIMSRTENVELIQCELVQDFIHKTNCMQIIAIETGKDSKNIFNLNTKQLKQNVVLVVGSEKYGMSTELLNTVTEKYCIPMFGINRSMNVAMALAIAAYQFKKCIN